MNPEVGIIGTFIPSKKVQSKSLLIGSGMLVIGLAALACDLLWIENPTLSAHQGKMSFKAEKRMLAGSELKLAWMLAYPKSGSGYVQALVEDCGGTNGVSWATNFGEISAPNDSTPVFADEPMGPFVGRTDLGLPEKYMLTTTYCFGFCDNCHPNSYLEETMNYDVWKEGCCKTNKYVDGTIQKTDLHYDEALVEKAVIVLRSPFDNLVSRYNEVSSKTLEFVNSPEGFQKYCHSHDFNHVFLRDEANMWNDPKLFAYAVRIPCHAEFMRYLQWYNHAFKIAKEITDKNNGEYLVLHYEDFHVDAIPPATALFDYLEQPYDLSSTPELKILGVQLDKKHYFIGRQLEDIANFFKEFSSPEVYAEMKHYFE